MLAHEITIDADYFLPVDKTLIPTGELRDVGQTPFDFREYKAVGDDIDLQDTQLTYGNGYDHCWVLNNQDEGVRFVASVDPLSGRLLEVFPPTRHTVLLRKLLDGTLKSREGGNLGSGQVSVLRQHYPNSPNQKFSLCYIKPRREIRY